MNRILDIGFSYAGKWNIIDGMLELELINHGTSKNILYSFVCNGEIKYIGKTTQQLNKRLYGYKKPASSQLTNIKNNKNITRLIESGVSVEIFVLVDNGLLNYGGYSLNIAAGLEDSLITTLKPSWNDGFSEAYMNEIKTENIKLEDISNEKQDQTNLNHTDDLDSKIKFTLQLQIAYYNHGFINVPTKYSREFGVDKDEMKFFIKDYNNPIIGSINRNANSTGTPRLMGRKEFTKQIKENFIQGQFIEVTILSPHSVFINATP